MLDYIHCFTKEHENQGNRSRQLYCMYNILYRENQAPFFTNKQQQWMIWMHSWYSMSMVIDSQRQERQSYFGYSFKLEGVQ